MTFIAAGGALAAAVGLGTSALAVAAGTAVVAGAAGAAIGAGGAALTGGDIGEGALMGCWRRSYRRFRWVYGTGSWRCCWRCYGCRWGSISSYVCCTNCC